MPSVRELTELYANVMLGPRRGPSVCGTCFNFTDGYTRCYACDHGRLVLDAVAADLLQRRARAASSCARQLQAPATAMSPAALARASPRSCGAFSRARALPGARRRDGRFELVTTVPSGDRDRDERHPLRWIVGELVAPTRDRYRRLLAPLRRQGRAASVQPGEVRRHRRIDGRSVLLIDDTWTTGASAQSAAAALKAAGAGATASVVIGRHLNREWHENDRRIRGIARPFDWSMCALCAEPTRRDAPGGPDLTGHPA